MPITRRIHLWLGWGLSAAVFVGAADRPVSFTSDIRPVFENTCWKCHGGAIQLSKLDLRTREAALKGGQKGAAIVPGKADESRLVPPGRGTRKARHADGRQTHRRADRHHQGLDRPGRALGQRGRRGSRRPPPAVARRDADSAGGAELLGVSEAGARCRAGGRRTSRIRSIASWKRRAAKRASSRRRGPTGSRCCAAPTWT